MLGLTNLLPLVASISVMNVFLLIIVYLISVSVNFKRGIAWAKMEMIELLGYSIIILLLISILPSLYNISLSPFVDNSYTIFEGAEHYFSESITFVSEVLNMARYHVASFYMLEARSLYLCDAGESSLPFPYNFVINNCFFGNGGSTLSPFIGISFLSQMFYTLLQLSIISKLSLVINFIIYIIATTTLPSFLIPLGILLKPFPFTKSIASVFLALGLGFLFIYPLVFASLEPYVEELYNSLTSFTEVNPTSYSMETLISIEKDYRGSSFSMPFAYPAGALTEKSLKDDILFKKLFGDNVFDYDKFPGALALASIAFMFGTFLPNLALVATIAIVYYVSRSLRMQIDLAWLTFIL